MIKYGDKIIASMLYIRISNKCGERYWDMTLIENHGIFLGFRTLRNGYTSQEDSTVRFNYKSKLKAAYVSISDTLNPIYVPVEHMKLDTKKD